MRMRVGGFLGWIEGAPYRVRLIRSAPGGGRGKADALLAAKIKNFAHSKALDYDGNVRETCLTALWAAAPTLIGRR